MSEDKDIGELNEALRVLVPEPAEFCACAIPSQAEFAFKEEELAVAQSGDYRKREFAAGRFCARAALLKAGFKAGPISVDEDGLPKWPDEALAVISHSRGYCAAIASSRSRFRVIGLDLEKTNRLSSAAIERVVHQEEQSFVKDDQRLASLLFCAKEAFYKAQYPEWETSANFHDVVLSVDMDAGSAEIVRMHERFPQQLRDLAGLIEFRFRFFGDFVVCLCWLRNVV